MCKLVVLNMNKIQSCAASTINLHWYQTADRVTAYVGLKGIPTDKMGDITACFGEQYCAVYVGGKQPSISM